LAAMSMGLVFFLSSFTKVERSFLFHSVGFLMSKPGRTTFISKEAASFLRPKLKNLEDNDLVFGSNENINYARTNEIITLERVLNKAGLDEKYDGVNRRKITLHSFRAYFFTKAARVHDENYAHKLTGHGGYLPQYDRLTDDEKLSMYLELEPELLVYDHSRKSAEIERLKREKSELERNEDKIQELSKTVEEIKNHQFETQKTLTHSVIEGLVASLDEWGRAGGKIPKGKEKAWKRKLELENRLFREIALLRKSTGKEYKVKLKDYE